MVASNQKSYYGTFPVLGNLGDVANFNPKTLPDGYVLTWDSTTKKATFKPNSGPVGELSKTLTFTTGNWNDGGSFYFINILKSWHNLSSTPDLIAQEIIGGNYVTVGVEWYVNNIGDITVKVSKTPDLRFNGRFIVKI